jgi:nucleoside phosphorylase
MEGGPSRPSKQTDVNLQNTSDEYTVGYICAICTEYIAAQAALDEEHKRPSHVAPGDQNDYTFGRIGAHNVVIAVLPDGEYGVESAAIVARDMMHSFVNIKVGLMVGIGGGAPSKKHDIRLGDIVVGVPRNGQSGVLQYGFGKVIQGQPFQATRLLNQAPRILRAAVNGLQSQHRLKGFHQLRKIIDDILEKNPTLRHEFGRPESSSDVLYCNEIIHPEDSNSIIDCSVSCGHDPSKLVERPRRIADEGAPVVHYGIIGSSNTLMKDAVMRDKYAEENNVLCFEMEAAGLMNQFPCLVIRGISDYSDSHKNKRWQGYAALAAVAYAKDLLYRIPSENISMAQKVVDGEEKAQISDDNHIQALLKSLKFDAHNMRYDSIKAPHAGTCKWLQESAEYVTWIDPDKINHHRGILCLKGNPGSGKSTTMKSVLVNARETMRDRILLSFFFNVQGQDLEKSTLGMYRSLLLQLFQQLPALQDALDLSTFTAYDGENYQWHMEPLKSLFHQAIENIQTKKVVCFIDALDECDEDQARDMISFFQNLSVLAISKGISFLVCFSRRHYPFITIPFGICLILECQKGHSQDITKYVRSELKIGNSDVANQIHASLMSYFDYFDP